MVSKMQLDLDSGLEEVEKKKHNKQSSNSGRLKCTSFQHMGGGGTDSI